MITRAILFINICLAISLVQADIVDPYNNLSGISYSCYIPADDAWQDAKDGEVCGTTGQSKQLELLSIRLESGYDCELQYRVHVQDIGWMDWDSSDQIVGAFDDESEIWISMGKQIEAIQIRLAACPDVNVFYKVHVQNIGWMDWVKNGEVAGTTGQSLRMEAIQIKVENPPAKYDYAERPYSFFDGKTGYVYLPLVEIGLPNEPWSSYDIQTRMRLIPPSTFEVESVSPYLIGSLVPFIDDDYKPFFDGETGKFEIPTVVVNTADGVQIYKAVLDQSPSNPKQFSLANLKHLAVPFNVDNFCNCFAVNLPTFSLKNNLSTVIS